MSQLVRLNRDQVLYAPASLQDEVNQLFVSVAFSSLTRPEAHTITLWADQGTGTYPLSSNRGATESSNVTIQPNTGEIGAVDKIEFTPNANPIGLHVDSVSGDLYFDATNLTGGGGTGDVVGPAVATDNNIARFDGATGKLIQNSLIGVSDSGLIDGIQSLAFQAQSAGAHGAFAWEIATGTASGVSVVGPWAAPPDVPWEVERNGNTCTMTIGPSIALNDGASDPISVDFGASFANFIPVGAPQHGTVLVRDAGVDKMVSWIMAGAPGFTLSISSNFNVGPANGLAPFLAGSTGQTGFPNTMTFTWLIASPP